MLYQNKVKELYIFIIISDVGYIHSSTSYNLHDITDVE